MQRGHPPPRHARRAGLVFSRREMRDHAMRKCNWNTLRQINKLKGTTCIWNALCRGFLTCLHTAVFGAEKSGVFTQLGLGACQSPTQMLPRGSACRSVLLRPASGLSALLPFPAVQAEQGALCIRHCSCAVCNQTAQRSRSRQQRGGEVSPGLRWSQAGPSRRSASGDSCLQAISSLAL